MPKRSCPDDDEIQPIKKQQNNEFKSRKIRSLSSERSLQLLYEGATKNEHIENKNDQLKGSCLTCKKSVIAVIRCEFCERDICEDCTNLCYKCHNEFCCNCTFPTYDHNNAVCYSCCSY